MEVVRKYRGRVTPRLGRDLCVEDARSKLMEELYEEVETMRGFCYLGDRVNASDGC